MLADAHGNRPRHSGDFFSAITSHLQQTKFDTYKFTATMIVNLAVYIVLILSFQHHPVVGKFPTTIATKGESTSNAESKVHRKRQLKKETKSKSKKVDQWFEDVERDVDMIQEAPTIWPTYSPSIIVSDAPTHEDLIPSIDFVPTANCDPIGSRPTISRPKRNDPLSSPSSSPLPVTFRRGDLRKDITRFGFKGQLLFLCVDAVAAISYSGS